MVKWKETLLSHLTPDSKQKTMDWRHVFTNKEKIQTDHFKFKFMSTVFWDTKRFLLLEFLPQVSTINIGVYCDTVEKLRRAIQNKRRGMLSRGVVMLHHDARPNTAPATQDLNATFCPEQVDHPPTGQT
jgi:hypothetical protein